MTTDTDRILLVIAGPTASGKTDAAVRVAAHFATEIISADSRQFYRELNIGTAKPTAGQMQNVPHHFVGHISIHDDYNISRFEREALVLLESLFGNHPVVVTAGGSGLYIDALCKGIDDLPDADPSIRKQLREGYEHYGIQYLRNRLLDLDPDYYTETDISNPQRLIRALEVCMTTGRPYSELRVRSSPERPFRTLYFGLMPARDLLNSRIDARVDRMMAEGLLEEARSLFPFRNLNALQTVGYRELFEYFDGKTTLDDAVAKIKTNTRRYAKRQVTWFKRNPEMHWIDPDNSDVFAEIISLL